MANDPPKSDAPGPPKAEKTDRSARKTETPPAQGLSRAKLVALAACFALYTACVIVATKRYCEHQYEQQQPQAWAGGKTSAVIRYQKLDGTVLYMTPEEFNVFKRKEEDATRSALKDSEPALSPALILPDAGKTEVFELPKTPTVKSLREKNGRRTPEAGGEAKSEPPPGTQTVIEIKEEKRPPAPPPLSATTPEKKAATTPPVETAKPALKQAPAATPADAAELALQIKMLRTKVQAYASEVERLGKNIEIVPEEPGTFEMRTKLKSKLEAAKKSLQDATSQLEALLARQGKE
jgi:hypothetical protein